MKYYLITLCFLCSTLLGFSQNNSSINFTIRNLGINVDGHFNTFSIVPKFKNNQLVQLAAEIEVSSIKTGIDSRDEHLLKDDYFNTDKYPFIRLNSTEIKRQKDNSYIIKARLTIKGETKIITIPLQINKTETSYKITAIFKIDRSDFKVGGGGLIMSKTVNVNIVYYHKL